MPVAFVGPALLIVIVKVTFWLIVGAGLLTVFVKLRSELETMVVGSLVESFAVFTCPPPETVATLVKLEAAPWATATVILSDVKLKPAFSTFVFVQVTV